MRRDEERAASVFLSSEERELLRAQQTDAGFLNQWTATRARVVERAAQPGLSGSGVTTRWWYHVAEFLTDAAIVQAFEPSDDIARWLRSVTLELVRRGEDDWIGPPFRDHSRQPPVGHLETAHLAVGVSIALDLVPEIFLPAERDEIARTLQERAIPLCRAWLDFAERLNNWRCILAAGLAVASAVTANANGLERARDEFELCCGVFQHDGSYAESLQYANYAAWGLMLVYESLHRTGNAAGLTISAYAKKAIWDAYSSLYTKPLAGWGATPRPRAVNFNDSAALYRPSGDVLMHIAARATDDDVQAAAVARWLYDLHYAAETEPNAAPHDRATFGFYNTSGFLACILGGSAREGTAPDDLALPEAAAFENGDILVRRSWNGDTILAIRAGGATLNAPSHLHGDMNSFTVTHRRERLLVDPGHSCYRNITRAIEIDARSHNTCVFIPREPTDQDVRQEDLFKSGVLSQKVELRRSFRDGQPGPAVDRGTRLLLLGSGSGHTAVVADAAAVYDEAVRKFTRSWLMLGESLIVVHDEIEFTTPCRTEWNWLVNNRDGAAETRQHNGVLVVRRGGAGMQLRSGAEGGFQGPLYGLLHDAYHPEPRQLGEGRPGSALIYRATSPVPSLGETRTHLIVLDSSARIGRWKIETTQKGFVVDAPGRHGSAEIDSGPNEGIVLRCRGTGAVPSASIELSHDGSYHT